MSGEIVSVEKQSSQHNRSSTDLKIDPRSIVVHCCERNAAHLFTKASVLPPD